MTECCHCPKCNGTQLDYFPDAPKTNYCCECRATWVVVDGNVVFQKPGSPPYGGAYIPVGIAACMLDEHEGRVERRYLASAEKCAELNASILERLVKT